MPPAPPLPPPLTQKKKSKRVQCPGVVCDLATPLLPRPVCVLFQYLQLAQAFFFLCFCDSELVRALRCCTGLYVPETILAAPFLPSENVLFNLSCLTTEWLQMSQRELPRRLLMHSLTKNLSTTAVVHGHT